MTNTLTQWQQDHGVSDAALEDLRQRLLSDTQTASVPNYPEPPMQLTETGVQQRVRVAYAERGGAVWRNNVGVMMDPDTGAYVRFGLANDSPQMNKNIKSSDLIGIMPRKITQDMVGSVIGQFIAREVKRSDWVYRGTAHEEAQMKWLLLILSMGGDAAFTTGGL